MEIGDLVSPKISYWTHTNSVGESWWVAHADYGNNNFYRHSSKNRRYLEKVMKRYGPEPLRPNTFTCDKVNK